MRKLDIDAEDWAELSKLLDAALELPVQEWQRWLATLSIYHEPLKPRLRELLSQIARAECNDFLRTLPKLEFATEGASARASALIGSSVGPYRLIRELGRGGMGSVWLAERIDGLINRSIALKIPHVVTKQAALAERMAREREILATLTHRAAL